MTLLKPRKTWYTLKKFMLCKDEILGDMPSEVTAHDTNTPETDAVISTLMDMLDGKEDGSLSIEIVGGKVKDIKKTSRVHFG